MRRGLAPSRNSQQESGANLFIVGNKSNGGDWVPLNARSERRWDLCAEPLQAGPRCGWAAAGTGLCRWPPPKDSRRPAPRGPPQPGSTPFPVPRDPSHPVGAASRGARLEGEAKAAAKVARGCCRLLGAWCFPAEAERERRHHRGPPLSPPPSPSIASHQEPALADLVSASFPS